VSSYRTPFSTGNVLKNRDFVCFGRHGGRVRSFGLAGLVGSMGPQLSSTAYGLGDLHIFTYITMGTIFMKYSAALIDGNVKYWVLGFYLVTKTPKCPPDYS